MAIVMFFFLTGCQTGGDLLQHTGQSQLDFGGSWSAYSACKQSRELRTVLKQADSLSPAIQPAQLSPAGQPQLGLGARVAALLVANKPRYAADPQVMALDCWLHAGRIAEQQGQPEVAHRMYTKVLQGPRTADTAYFVGIAQSNLSTLQIPLQALAPSTAVAPSN